MTGTCEREAILYEKLGGGKVQCALCAHRCIIKDGWRGKCGVRENRGGTLTSLVYGRLISANVDPIEKKPLFHYRPGSLSFSIATAGCNFKCMHCQNADISQWPRDHRNAPLPGEEATPGSVVDAAVRTGSGSISYTYTEPTIAMEFYLETAGLARERGLGNVFVSNGYMTPESVGIITPLLDADNIDLKGDDDFYREVCGASSAGPVKDTIERMKAAGVWVEVTTLVIPGHNDSDRALREIAGFIASVDPLIPWHVTRFHPTYRLTDSQRTPLETLERASTIGREAGLKYVYEGNVPGTGGEDTYCRECGRPLIRREGFMVLGNSLVEGGRCPHCNTTQAGVW